MGGVLLFLLVMSQPIKSQFKDVNDVMKKTQECKKSVVSTINYLLQSVKHH